MLPHTNVRSAERRQSGGVWLMRRDRQKIDVACVRTKLAKGGRSSQVEAFNKARRLVIDGFQIGIDDPLDLIRHHFTNSPNQLSSFFQNFQVRIVPRTLAQSSVHGAGADVDSGCSQPTSVKPASRAADSLRASITHFDP